MLVNIREQHTLTCLAHLFRALAQRIIGLLLTAIHGPLPIMALRAQTLSTAQATLSVVLSAAKDLVAIAKRRAC